MGLIGLKEKSLDTIIRKSYENLGLITFFTCGPKEIHAIDKISKIPLTSAFPY